MGEPELEKEIRDARPDEHGINPLILKRWSPRSFQTKPVSEEDLLGLLEAARWAPSCFNEQPWRFLVARKPEDLLRMRSCLAEHNRTWADRAPVLLTVISSPIFALDKRPNRWNAFDSGAAWGYLALEAARRGLVAHAMGGFSQKKIRELFRVPEDWGVHTVVAVGYRAPREQLPQELQEREHPSTRRALQDIWREGTFGF